jgi:MFS family permease
MVVDDGERQPLLSNQRGGAVKEESWLSSCISTIRSSWSVYQIVLLLLVYQISYYGQVAATFDIVRDLTCARHYERNPDLIDPSDDDPCSSDLIESQSARILLIFELLFGLGSAFATIHFGKKLSTWGRKPILIISLFTLILYPLACIVVPRGYPYGPVASEAIITPSTSITILGVVSAATGLLGGAALPMCCFRLLVVDHSDTADRTKNLGFVMVSYLVGIMIGPLISAVGSYVLPIYARGVDGALISIVHRLFRSHLDTVSNMTIRQSEHGNVTPFIICVFGGIFSIIYVILFVKETAFSSRPAAEVGSEENDPTPVSHTEAKPSKLPITPLRAIIPIKQKDGTYDMRITALFLTMVLVLCASSGLEIIILFFGHGMHWAASSVGYLISSLGATRLVTMSLLLPSLLVLLERRVRRPGIIAQYTVEELHKISKGSTSEETPVDASAFASEANLDETRLQQGAISLWRAKIDRYIVLVSWG